jgi:hypothetical protein
MKRSESAWCVLMKQTLTKGYREGTKLKQWRTLRMQLHMRINLEFETVTSS